MFTSSRDVAVGLIAANEKFYKAVLSPKGDTLILVGTKNTRDHLWSNKVYLFRIRVLAESIELALTDTIDLESVCQEPNKTDLLSTLAYFETERGTFLTTVSRVSGKANFLKLCKDDILEVCEEADIAETFGIESIECTLFKGSGSKMMGLNKACSSIVSLKLNV